MADYPDHLPSKSQVRRAGKALGGTLPVCDESIRIFQIANAWCDAHARPMQRVRAELAAKVRAAGRCGYTVSRRKSMRSIRKKIQRHKTDLSRIQDLGGCRAIVDDMEAVNRLLDVYRSKALHQLHREDDYICNPKQGGYRCHHLVYKFASDGPDSVFNGLPIEVQIRTRLQHAWATCVEAVGLYRNEDLKASEGSLTWLRLFELMSAELAWYEGFRGDIDQNEHKHRLAEIQHLENTLGAVQTLESIRFAHNFTLNFQSNVENTRYFIVTFDHEMQQVNVKAHSTLSRALDENSSDEFSRLTIEDGDKLSRVVLEASKAEYLKQAFPNYFGDVQLFSMYLRQFSLGTDGLTYTMDPQERVPMPRPEIGDLSWLRLGKHRRWK